MRLIFYSKIAGVASGDERDLRQRMLGYMAKYPERPWQLVLSPEPDNPYDPNAIKVLVGGIRNQLRQLGYLPKETAAKLIVMMGRDGVQPIAVLREITGGEDGQSFGANLAIYDRREFGPER